MVKSLKERLAEKRDLERRNGPVTAVATTTSRPEHPPCLTCKQPAIDPPYCDACRALRYQMTATRPKPDPKEEKKPVTTSTATNQKPSIDPARIKEIRLKHGMTQSALGARLNVSNPTISLWETGKTTPSVPFVRQLLELETMEPMPEPAPAPAPYPIPDPAETRAQLAEYRAKKVAEAAATLPTPEPESSAVFDADARRMAEAQNLTVDDADDTQVEAHAIDREVQDARNIEHEVFYKRALRAEARADALEARLDEAAKPKQVTTADGWGLARKFHQSADPQLRDNLDAFRLLVRTFGIDTADQVVDLLRG
jgi:DNA-binding transcriptional regulator YiaG